MIGAVPTGRRPALYEPVTARLLARTRTICARSLSHLIEQVSIGGETPLANPRQSARQSKICIKTIGCGRLTGIGDNALARIRHIEISNFRSIREFSWWPSAGINCLMGPGDVGKSSILDAIDLCLGARRNVQFTDVDFNFLDIEKPIIITITIGELDDSLKNMESYGNFLRGCSVKKQTIEDEPEKDCETVLTVRLTVAGDLEPVWTLVSERAAAQSQSRYLNWNDRVRLMSAKALNRIDFKRRIRHCLRCSGDRRCKPNGSARGAVSML